ncbi:MAG: alanine--tRNA ligase, partial [Deltaproteobacteria bacterium]|nr:alanine--tRNA ligase [Deltaproteobacteria bacterium]
CDRYLELWNLVFMQYDRDGTGKLTPLPKPSIDTGLGLERLSAVMQGRTTNYETDLFTPIIKFIEELSKKTYGKDNDTDISIRAIADHARASAFLISDGLLPSNEGRGYVLRRIMRRAARHGRFIGFKTPFLHKVAALVADFMGTIYPELIQAKELIVKATESEEERFFETLDKGLSILTEEIKSVKKAGANIISGAFAFKLYDTYGFPLDLTADILRKDGLTVDEDEFTLEMERQKETARKSWKGTGSEADETKAYIKLSEKGLTSKFVGYDLAVTSADVTCILKDGAPTGTALQGDRVVITTAETPFYGESGGQRGDTGVMVGTGVIVKVLDTLRPTPTLTIHQCVIEEGTVEIN